jgi:non-lysosomal glucosylceramidase
MPSCAWTREMGNRPVYESFKIYASPGFTPGMMTKKGMPIGGIGAGNFMYNICGSFGPFRMKPGVYEERFLTQAAFHVREEIKGQVTCRTLATEDVLPAWNRLENGDAVYSALFPKATFDYKAFQTDLSLLYFSPVIKDNYRETSYPVGMFLFKAKNNKPHPVKLSFMFTFPNAPYVQTPDSLCGKNNFLPCRTGLYNRAARNRAVTSVLMGASDERNTVETQNTSWCIATSLPATYVDVWDGEGDGSDIWSDFAQDGKLSGKSLCSVSAMPSGALCVTVSLKPGEEKVVPFALSWYFPTMSFGQGALWNRRFTEYFPYPDNGQSEQALTIASEGLREYNKWLDAVDAWTLPIAENKNCPDWLKAGALNELYYTTFGGSFWENGCVNREKKIGARPGQHISGAMECIAYAYFETFDVRHHAARATRDLWPKNEKDILLAYADIIMSTTLGSCPHDLGGPHFDPFNSPDTYVKKYEPGKETTSWSEFSPKFIQQLFMYWKQYRDDEFLDECWLAIKRSFNYQVATDKDDDGITEMTSSEYIDNKLLNAVLWITSLEALKEMATYRNDAHMLLLANEQLAKARPNSEKQFWNDTLGYYQYNAENPNLMADAFVGQRCADVFGLPPVLDDRRMVSHFEQCFERLVKPLRDDDGDGIGDLGAANILNPQGEPGVETSEHAHANEVWTGVTYNLAASMYHWGVRSGNEALKRNALLTGKGVYGQCWLNEDNGFWFSSPEACWFQDMPKARGLMYQRVRGIWELMMEVAYSSPHKKETK